MVKITAAIAAFLVCTSASAQVYRCPDKATGRLTYSDAPCTDGRQIVRQMSDEERALNAERAGIARERAQLERERAAIRQQQDAPIQQRQAAAGPAIDQIACQKAKRELSIASNIKSEDTRRRMNRAIIEVNEACGTKTELLQEPPKIYVEPRHGPMTCQGVGATMVCN
jgi:hypothetical protein